MGVVVWMIGENPAEQPALFASWVGFNGRQFCEASLNFWKKRDFLTVVGFNRTTL
jgi:hypothetical protein